MPLTLQQRIVIFIFLLTFCKRNNQVLILQENNILYNRGRMSPPPTATESSLFPPLDVNRLGVPQPSLATKDILIIIFMFLLWAYSLYLTYRAWYKLLYSDGEERSNMWRWVGWGGEEYYVEVGMMGRRGAIYVKVDRIERRGVTCW